MSLDPPEEKPRAEFREAEERDRRGRRWGAAGVGVGIGSAAILAALLYANRSGRERKRD